MTDPTPLERAMKNPELMKRAEIKGKNGRWGQVYFHEDTPESILNASVLRLCFIAAAAMMVLERGLSICKDETWPGHPYEISSDPDPDSLSSKVLIRSPDLLTTLLDALEAVDE